MLIAQEDWRTWRDIAAGGSHPGYQYCTPTEWPGQGWGRPRYRQITYR